MLSFIYATYPPAGAGSTLNAGIFGLAGSGGVSARHHCHSIVSSCLTVSPLVLAGRSDLCYALPEVTPTCAFRSGVPFLSGLSSENL